MKFFLIGFLALILLSSCVPDSVKNNNPLENLPSHITQLTEFGERAAWSPDGKKIAFIKQSFNDAFEIELETGEIRNLTESCPYHAFLRIQYLPDGNFLLIGPEMFKDIKVSREEDAVFWWMPGDASSGPLKLAQKVNEGVAISRTDNFISWGVNGEGMYTGFVTVQNGIPSIIEKKLIKPKPEQGFEEPQDFRKNNTELIHSHYHGDGLSEVMGLNLETGEIINYTSDYPSYDEPEGIFPGGEYTCVESDRSGKGHGSQYIDIWKLKLDGSEEVGQLTFFTDYPGFKATNPVISPDGKTMAFQTAKLGDPAGFGRGILLYHFEKDEK